MFPLTKRLLSYNAYDNGPRCYLIFSLKYIKSSLLWLERCNNIPANKLWSIIIEAGSHIAIDAAAVGYYDIAVVSSTPVKLGSSKIAVIAEKVKSAAGQYDCSVKQRWWVGITDSFSSGGSDSLKLSAAAPPHLPFYSTTKVNSTSAQMLSKCYLNSMGRQWRM